MAFHRRRLAAFDTLIPSLATHHGARAEVDHSTTETMSTNSIAPFATGLNGVDQPRNFLFKDVLWGSLGAIALLILFIRLAERYLAKLRLVSTMALTGEQQSYWKKAQWAKMPWIKRAITYAPLFKKRHNREIRLSSAINVGTLPSRLHAILLAFYLLSNIIYMFVLNYHKENVHEFCAELRGRSGTLAAVNMVPLIILAARNNPLIPMLMISFDTFNLIHRWMGRVVVIETVIHVIAWMVVQVADSGWGSLKAKLVYDDFMASGTVGSFALVILLILSFSPIRHAFYETFLNTHIILAFIIFVCTYVHCQTAALPGGLPQLPWIGAIALLWFFERLGRMCRVAFRNFGGSVGFAPAIVEPMPGEACRVTLQLPNYVDIQPGTHAYLRFKEINMWESHPFSIAWVEHTPIDRHLPVNEKDEMLTPATDRMKTSVSFLIGAQTGFTRKLYDTARKSDQTHVNLKAVMEGPYAGHHSLDSYGHAVLFAGATGITHQISYIKHLINGYNEGIVATRKITLVWVVRDYEALEWIRPWMDEILGLPNRKELLHIMLFITRPKNPSLIKSGSDRMQMFSGRPQLKTIIQKEVAQQVGAMCVTVCGPGALADDVRSAVNLVQPGGNVVDFIEESFTW